MRILVTSLTISVLANLGFAAPASGDHAPAYVVPGRTDVPVLINGRNAAWGVVEGDWGLYRPGAVAPTVIGGAPPVVMGPREGGYYPFYGEAPPRGRLEIEPPANAPKPKPAPTFYRSWISQSDPSAPVTVYPPAPPVVIPAPVWPGWKP